jgi:DNA-binding NarL/FixJ family response regulator
MTVLQNETIPRARKVVTHREISHDDLQLLRLLATGLPVDSVARRLDLSERTVRRRTRAACDRLGFGTAVEAIVWAARRGLL